ncbi:hypothetical protein RQP46_008622 [Phenoliferia psychrophenolica]
MRFVFSSFALLALVAEVVVAFNARSLVVGPLAGPSSPLGHLALPAGRKLRLPTVSVTSGGLKVAAVPQAVVVVSEENDANDDYLKILRGIRVKREGPRRIEPEATPWHAMNENFSYVEGHANPALAVQATRYRQGRPSRSQQLDARRMKRDGEGTWTSGIYSPKFEVNEGGLMS